MRSVVVSLIGRPNVGKSSLFNRLLRKNQKALTYDLPGVTRDRHYGIMATGGHGKFESEDLILVDTGGFYPDEIEESNQKNKKSHFEPFFNVMREQAQTAINESDMILFVVDVREGLLPFDRVICDHLRRQKKPFWLIVNKYDTDAQQGSEMEFFSMGLNTEEMILTSAEHNRGIEEIRQRLCEFSFFHREKISQESLNNASTPDHEVVASVSIIGAPNVGKSTLLNQLLGANRALVSDIAGTTIDPIEGYFNLDFGPQVQILKEQQNEFYQHNLDLLEDYQRHLQASTVDEQVDQIFGDEEEIGEEGEALDEQVQVQEEVIPIDGIRSIKIVDTAGIRKSRLIQDDVESQSIYRSLRSITDSDVVIYMVDSTKGITHQDRRLLDVALEKGKSVVICLNKIDLMQEVMQDKEKKKEWVGDLRYKVPWLEFCELIPLSALKGSHLKSLKRVLIQTILIRNEKIPTSRLNKAIETLVNRNPVTIAGTRGAKLKVKYASQVKSDPPTIMLFTNKSKGIPENFRKYLVNGIRREFSLINTPVHLVFRTTSDMKRNLTKKDRLSYQELT